MLRRFGSVEIAAVDFVHLFTSPDGRIARARYWIGWLIILAVEVALRLALNVPFTPTPADPLSARALSFLIDAVLLYPSIMVMVKRLHDRDRSGWAIGWLIVPYIVMMITNVLGMSGDPEHMGAVETLLLLATTVIMLAFMIELGFRRGMPGDNQFGPAPQKLGA
jgi:uncharacterized membrane protein YhaH (DUF805 family)